MGVSSNLKWRFLKLEMTLGSNFRFEKDRASKKGVFTTIFWAKIEKNWVFHFFQYFTVNYHKRIHLQIFSTLFVNISHAFWSQNKEVCNYAHFFLLTTQYSSIVTKIYKILPNKVENIKNIFLFCNLLISMGKSGKANFFQFLPQKWW